MTTVGFVGSGQIGGPLARLAVEAGHQVVLSNSRGPETLNAAGLTATRSEDHNDMAPLQARASA